MPSGGREVDSPRARVAVLERSGKYDAKERTKKFRADLKTAVLEAIDAHAAGDVVLYLSDESLEGLKDGVLEQIEKG